MWRVNWSDQAIDDLDAITRYVRDFSPAAAARFELELVAVAESLTSMPERGRMTDRGCREMTLTRPYIIRYVVVHDEVRILSIRHAARRPLP